MRNFFFTLLLPLLTFSSCSDDVVYLEYKGLSKPVYDRDGISVVSWKKVLLPEVNLKPVGYVKVMKFRLDEDHSSTYFEVLDRYYLPMGNISALGDVRKYSSDEFTNEPVILELGEHTFYIGVARLLGYKGEELYKLRIVDLEKEDTFIYQNYLKRLLKENKVEARMKALKKAAEEDEESDDDC